MLASRTRRQCCLPFGSPSSQLGTSAHCLKCSAEATTSALPGQAFSYGLSFCRWFEGRAPPWQAGSVLSPAAERREGVPTAPLALRVLAASVVTALQTVGSAPAVSDQSDTMEFDYVV